MSKLRSREAGRVIPGVGEWVNSYRWARARLSDETVGPGTVYVLAGSGPDVAPLQVTVNGVPVAQLPSGPDGRLRWHAVRLDSAPSGPGLTVELTCPGAELSGGWSLALEASAHGHSELSVDAGGSWRPVLGANASLPGNYLVRYRCDEGTDGHRPSIWMPSPTAAPATDVLRERIRRTATTNLNPADTDATAIELTKWACDQVNYASSADRLMYAPWEPNLILDWGHAGTGVDARPAVTMCVHKSVLLVHALSLFDIAARAVVLTAGIGSFDGHFCAEYWSPASQSWVLLDPTLPLIFRDGERALSALDVSRARTELGRLAVPISVDGATDPVVSGWWAERIKTGAPFRYVGVWASPQITEMEPYGGPPGHGAIEYCETDIIWLAECLEQGFGMFRWFAPESAFEAAPNAVVPARQGAS